MKQCKKCQWPLLKVFWFNKKTKLFCSNWNCEKAACNYVPSKSVVAILEGEK